MEIRKSVIKLELVAHNVYEAVKSDDFEKGKVTLQCKNAFLFQESIL